MCSVREALTMRSSRVLSLFFIVSLLLLDEVIVSGKPSCPAGHFRNQTTASALVHCSPCSTCAINHIVRKPCNRQNDTVCGPFYEFEFFNQRQQKPNQASDGLGWKRTMMKGDTDAEEDGGGGDGRHGHHLFYGQQTTNSPGEAEGESSSLRCGQATEWRVLCYGLVAAVVIVISVALSAVALFSYCRANAKTLRVSAETSRATSTIVTDADAPSSSAADHPSLSSSAALTSSSTTTTTIVVDRSVRHLEEQLFHNERRRAFLRWLFGSSDAASDRLFSSNDYLEERHRRRFLLLLEPSSSTASSARGRPTDALPLQPYPGMISTTARTDHDRSSQHPFTAAAGGGASDDGEAEDEAGRGNRMDRMPRSDEGSQADEQVSNHGERSRLIPEQ